MCSPVPTDPQDAVVANQYMNDINAFNEKAKEWVKIYAMPNPEFMAKVKEITDMGFSEEQAKEAGKTLEIKNPNLRELIKREKRTN